MIERRFTIICQGHYKIPRPEKVRPGWRRRALNYLKALFRHTADGLAAAPRATQRQRIALCVVCDYYRPSDETCAHQSCGCGVSSKAAWRSERCPAGKWN